MIKTADYEKLKKAVLKEWKYVTVMESWIPNTDHRIDSFNYTIENVGFVESHFDRFDGTGNLRSRVSVTSEDGQMKTSIAYAQEVFVFGTEVFSNSVSFDFAEYSKLVNLVKKNSEFLRYC